MTVKITACCSFILHGDGSPRQLELADDNDDEDSNERERNATDTIRGFSSFPSFIQITVVSRGARGDETRRGTGLKSPTKSC